MSLGQVKKFACLCLNLCNVQRLMKPCSYSWMANSTQQTRSLLGLTWSHNTAPEHVLGQKGSLSKGCWQVGVPHTSAARTLQVPKEQDDGEVEPGQTTARPSKPLRSCCYYTGQLLLLLSDSALEKLHTLAESSTLPDLRAKGACRLNVFTRSSHEFIHKLIPLWHLPTLRAALMWA